MEFLVIFITLISLFRCTNIYSVVELKWESFLAEKKIQLAQMIAS